MVTPSFRMALWLGLLSGCAQVLDIPGREVDPTFGAAGVGGTSSGGSGQTGAGQAGAAGQGTTLVVPTCAQFCKEADGLCKNTDTTPEKPGQYFKAYPSLGSCEAVCKTLTPGDPSNPKDLEGNTLLCRYNQLRLAMESGDLGKHCPAVGLGGANETEGYPCAAAAGSAVDFYCDQVEVFCPGAFAQRELCKKSAAGVPLVPPQGQSTSEGNSMQCRFYHLVAASEQPSTHCPHAAGAAPCCEQDPETLDCIPP